MTTSVCKGAELNQSLQTIPVPQPQWCWSYTSAKEFLVLQCADDLHLTTAYKGKHLAAEYKPELNCYFNLEHTETYFDMVDRVSKVLPNLPVSMAFEICVNAVAAKHLHKSIANKSWLLVPNNTGQPITCMVTIRSRVDKAVAMILQQDSGFATVMLLSEAMHFSDEQRSMSRYQILKVNVNLLGAFETDASENVF